MPLTTLLYALLLPALVGFGVTGLLRYRLGKKHGPRFSEIGVGVGFLAGFLALTGGLPFQNNVAHHVIGEIAVFALVMAVPSAIPILGRRARVALIWAGGTVTLAWSFGLWHNPNLPAEDWLIAAGAAMLALVLLRRLVLLAEMASAGSLVLLVLILGQAGVAAILRAGGLVDLSVALAAGLAGTLCWAWPFGRGTTGPGIILIGGMLLMALALAVGRTALALPWPMLLLLPGFWPDGLARRIPFLAKLARKKANRPWVWAVAAAIPVGAAIGLALLLAMLNSPVSSGEGVFE